MIPPTSIDGTDITGATIDGTEVQEITVDGDTVFTASISEFVDGGDSIRTNSGSDYRGMAFIPDLVVTEIEWRLMSASVTYPEVRLTEIGGPVLQTITGPFNGGDTGTFSGLSLNAGDEFAIQTETEDGTNRYGANDVSYPFGSANVTFTGFVNDFNNPEVIDDHASFRDFTFTMI